MDLTATLNQVQHFMEKGEEFKRLLEKYAIKVDKYDDFVFSALNIVASVPGIPVAWKAAIAVIQQFEKSSLSFLLSAVSTAENVTQAKGEDKLALAVSSIVNSTIVNSVTPVSEVPKIPAIVEEKKIEPISEPVSKVFQIVPTVVETVQAIVPSAIEKKIETSKVKEILSIASQVNSFVGVLNSFVKKV